MTLWAVDEPDHDGVGVPLLDAVEDAGDDVVATRGLPTREHDADFDCIPETLRRLRRIWGRGLELHERDLVSRREELLDRFSGGRICWDCILRNCRRDSLQDRWEVVAAICSQTLVLESAVLLASTRVRL